MELPTLPGVGVEIAWFGRGPGITITRTTATLADLPVAELKEWFRIHGVVGFHGFDASKTQFMNLARLFMKRVKTTPELLRRRDRLHPGLQTALIGIEGLGFHADFAQVPDRTHVICFFCAVPATWGGQTLVSDGEDLFRKLALPTQEALRTRRIRHSSTLDRANWSAFAGTQDAQLVVERARTVPGMECVHNADDSMTTHWVTSAVSPSHWGTEPCLCTNIFPGVYNGLSTTWEDGSPIDAAIIADLERAAREVANTFTWSRAGDFAIVDNTRCVHARTQQDGVRQVFTLQGYL